MTPAPTISFSSSAISLTPTLYRLRAVHGSEGMPAGSTCAMGAGVMRPRARPGLVRSRSTSILCRRRESNPRPEAIRSRRPDAWLRRAGCRPTTPLPARSLPHHRPIDRVEDEREGAVGLRAMLGAEAEQHELSL